MADGPNLGVLGSTSVSIDVPLGDLDKGLASARDRFRRAATDLQQTADGTLGASADRATVKQVALGRSIDKTTGAAENFRPAVTAAAKAATILGGVQAGPLGEFANTLIHIGATAGPVGVAIIALTSVVLAFQKTIEAARAPADRLMETMARQIQVSDRLKAAWDEVEKAAQEREAKAKGTTTTILNLQKELELTRDLRDARVEDARNLRNQGAGHGADFVLGIDITGEEKALKIAEGNYLVLAERVRGIEEDITRATKEEAQKRVDKTTEETKERAKAFAELLRGMKASAAAARDELAGLGDLGNSAEKAIKALDRERQRELDNLASDPKNAGMNLASAQREIFARFDARKKAIEAAFEKETRERAQALQRQAEELDAETAALDDDSFRAEIAALERGRDAAIAEAEKKGEWVFAVRELWAAKIRQATAKHAAEEIKAAQESREKEQAVADEAARDDFDALQRRLDAAGTVAEKLRDAAAAADFAMAQEDRNETERAVAEVARRYDDLLNEARAYGLDVTTLEKAIAEQQAKIRAGLTGARDSQSFGQGLGAQLDDFEKHLQTLGTLGADSAGIIRDGFKETFASAIKGSKGVGDALVAMANRFEDRLLDFAGDQIFMALFGNFGLGKTANTGLLGSLFGFAGGGSFDVGGGGGTDSQLVAFKATPGEHVEVGGRRGGGDGPRTVVIVENNTGQPSREERSAGPGGEERIRVIVGAIVTDDLRTRGPVSQALENRYGITRQGARR